MQRKIRVKKYVLRVGKGKNGCQIVEKYLQLISSYSRNDNIKVVVGLCENKCFRGNEINALRKAMEIATENFAVNTERTLS